MKQLICIALLLISLTSTKDYYLASRGNDNDSGSKTFPFRTLPRAYAAASNHDQIFFFPEIFEDSINFNIQFSKQLTLNSLLIEGSPKIAEINCHGHSLNWILLSANITFKNLRFNQCGNLFFIGNNSAIDLNQVIADKASTVIQPYHDLYDLQNVSVSIENSSFTDVVTSIMDMNHVDPMRLFNNYFESGIKIRNTYAKIAHTVFDNRKGLYKESLLYTESSAIGVVNVTFNNGIARMGGALFAYLVSITVELSHFSDNSAEWGGALFCIGASGFIEKSTFVNNRAHYNGMFCTASSLSLADNTMRDNTPNEWPGICNDKIN